MHLTAGMDSAVAQGGKEQEELLEEDWVCSKNQGNKSRKIAISDYNLAPNFNAITSLTYTPGYSSTLDATTTTGLEQTWSSVR